MNNYLLCADTDGAKVYNMDELEEGGRLMLTISHPTDIFSSVAEEMERLCGVGTDGKLVLSGEPKLINELCQKLSDEVRGRIMGIIPELFQQVS